MYLESGCLSFPCLEEEEEEEEEEGDDGLSDVSKFDREIVLVVMFCFVLFCFGVETNEWEKQAPIFKHFKAVSSKEPTGGIHTYIHTDTYTYDIHTSVCMYMYYVHTFFLPFHTNGILGVLKYVHISRFPL